MAPIRAFSDRNGVRVDGRASDRAAENRVGRGAEQGHARRRRVGVDAGGGEGHRRTLGHVAAEVGPGVFGYLRLLEPGDLIEVDREDGTTVIFRVDKLATYPQNNFPTSLVYGDIDYAGLRLITCTGVFNEKDKTFSSNLIVYTSLVGTK